MTKSLPEEVKNIVATKNIAKKIKLTWDKSKVVDFSHYNIYRSTSIYGDYDLLASIKENEYTDVIDEDGIDYFYRVSVVDGDDLESKHDEKSVHGKTLSKPNTPSLVEVKMVGDNLELSWKSTDPRVKSYIVNKRVSKSWIDKSSEEFIDIKDKVFIDKSIEPETTYYYTVSSVDEFSVKSEPSIEVKFTTAANQGRKIVSKEDNSQPMVDVKKSPVPNNDGNIVQPMEDIDMSGI
jgi:fibronectin type 3 domain-containing protein